MYLIFVNFVIYVSILSYTCAPIRNKNEESNPASIDIGPQVEGKIAHFTKIIQFLNMHHTPSVIPLSKFKMLGSQLEAKLEALLEMLIGRALKAEDDIKQLIEEKGSLKKAEERALKAEEDNKQLCLEKGSLQNQKEIFVKMLRFRGFRSRLETLVDDLYPERRPYHVSVPEAFNQILTSNDPKFKNRSCIKVFRQRVSKYGIPITDLVDAVRSICGSLSDKAAHKMSVFGPSPPKYSDVEGIKEMFENFGITPDKAMIMTAQIVLEPLPLLKCKRATVRKNST